MNTEVEKNVPIDENQKAADAVLSVAKQAQLPDDGIIERNGVKIKIESVPAILLDDVTSRIKDPDPPMVHIESKGREEPNPDDPEYLKELAEADSTRDRAAVDAMILFGINLIDGMPEDDGWTKNLKYLEKRGRLDLSNYDLEDEMDREFLYKRYMVADAIVLGMITKASGVSPEAIQSAEDGFQGN